MSKQLGSLRGRRRSLSRRPEATARRLLIVCSYFPPHVGGAEQYAHHLATALVATGRWDVTVVTTKGKGLRTHCSDEGGLRVLRLGWWMCYSYTPISPMWPWQLRRIIRSLDPDVINAHTPVPLLSDVATWVAGRRLFLLTYHAVGLEKDSGPLFDFVRSTYELLERFTLKRADAVLAVSAAVQQALQGRVAGRLVTFSNAVPRDELSDEAAEPCAGQFVFLARLDKEHSWKGLDLVLQAVSLCPQARLKVAGDGNLRSFYEKTSFELGVFDRIQFLGTVTGEAKDRLIRTSTALIAYPTTSNDGFPTVLLEAWANRVPVLAADIGALRTLVREGIDGLLVPPSQPVALAKAMRRLMDDPALVSRLGMQGRARVDDMTWERLAQRFEQLVESLLEERMAIGKRQ